VAVRLHFIQLLLRLALDFPPLLVEFGLEIGELPVLLVQKLVIPDLQILELAAHRLELFLEVPTSIVHGQLEASTLSKYDDDDDDVDDVDDGKDLRENCIVKVPGIASFDLRDVLVEETQLSVFSPLR
jgi:hypothetical protein